MTLKTYTFEIHKTLNKHGDPHYWSAIKTTSNHKTVWFSETYTSKQNAEIPVLKLINIIGKKKCHLIFHDNVRKLSRQIKL